MTGLRVFLSRHKAMTLVVRGSSATDLDSLRAAVRGVVQKVDPVVPISEIRMGEDYADPQLGAVRLTAEVSMLLGPVALTLAGLGLYGLISYAVSTRTREIGIRVAPTRVQRTCARRSSGMGCS